MYPGEDFVENDPEKGIITYLTDRTENEEPAAATIELAALKANVRRKLPKDLDTLNGLAEGDGKKLWDGYHSLDAVALEEDKLMARAVPVFPQMAIYLLKERRTPLQAFKWLKGFAQDNELEEIVSMKYFKYLLMAACLDNQGKSKMCITLTPRIGKSKPLRTFCTTRLIGTIGGRGAGAAQRRGALVTPQQATARDAEMRELREFRAVMINTVTEMGSAVRTLATQGTRTGNSNNKLKLTESKLWRLVGYCQARSPAHVPGVWG